MGEEVPTFFKYCLSDPRGRGEGVVQEGTQNSVKKGAHLGPLNEGERAHETRGAHPALTLASRVNKVGVLKLHSVGQDFASFYSS